MEGQSDPHSYSASIGRKLLLGRGWVWWGRLAEIIAVDLSPRKALSGNHSQQEHFYIPAQLYSSLVGKKNLIFFLRCFSSSSTPSLCILCNELLCHAMAFPMHGKRSSLKWPGWFLVRKVSSFLCNSGGSFISVFSLYASCSFRSTVIDRIKGQYWRGGLEEMMGMQDSRRLPCFSKGSLPELKEWCHIP